LTRASSAEFFEGLTVALALGDSSLSMAAVAKTISPSGDESRALVQAETAAFRQLPEAAARIEEFIAASLRKAAAPGVKPPPVESARLVVSFPRHLAIIRLLDLPSTDARELKSMARLQALMGLPFQEEELVSDVAVMSADAATGHSKVLLAIVQRSALAPYLPLFERLGRWPRGFVLDTLGTNEFIQRRKEPVPANHLLVGLMDGWLNVDVFKDGELRSSRSIPCGEKEPASDRILKECRQSLASAESDGSAVALQKIFVTGHSHGGQDQVAIMLAKELEAPVETLPDQSPGPSGVSVAVIGAAHADPKVSLMLLPAEILERQSRQDTRRGIAAAAAWLGIWLAVAAGVGGWRILRAEWRLSALDSQLKQLEPEARKVSGVLDQAALLHLQAGEGAAPLDILRELARSAPQGIILRTVSRAPDGGVLIQGSAPRLAVVMEFVNGLQHSPLFTRAELHGSSLSTIQNVDSVDFQIQGEIMGAAKPTVAAGKRRRA